MRDDELKTLVIEMIVDIFKFSENFQLDLANKRVDDLIKVISTHAVGKYIESITAY